MTTKAKVLFQVPEYQADGSFIPAEYQFEGSPSSGWQITRNGSEHLQLGPGYVLVESQACGVCSTDLARRFLPYPLPQIIGHEVVGRHEGKLVSAEINASHLARQVHDADDCPFCRSGLETQCPQRITLGIDRLPGGFAPYFLAPLGGLVPIPDGLTPDVAVLAEPFAAALQAVDSLPVDCLDVAVLGPRRLGLLLVGALACVRQSEGRRFTITAIARRHELLAKARLLGADQTELAESPDGLRDAPRPSPIQSDTANSTNSGTRVHEVVFDTTGTVDGFEKALQLAGRILHLKSTNGQIVCGFRHLTDLVVHEMALLPEAPESFAFAWPMEQSRVNSNVFVAPEAPAVCLNRLRSQNPATTFWQMSYQEALALVDAGGPKNSSLPRFDLAVVDSVAQADRVLRPDPAREISLVRPRGAIILLPLKDRTTPPVAGSVANPTAIDPSKPKRQANESVPVESELYRRVSEGLQLHSSRCGNFRRALGLLAANPQLAKTISKEMLTHHFALPEIAAAFAVAADSSQSIKVVVETRPNNEL